MTESSPEPSSGLVNRMLGTIERLGNRLPDPAFLFLFALLIVWGVSAILTGLEFTVPANDGDRVLAIQNQLTGQSLASFLSSMVTTFTGFAPLGVVLVALLGVGVA